MLTRRRFLACAGSLTAPGFLGSAVAVQAMTVADLMVRVRAALPAAPGDAGVDGLKAGSGSQRVTGVATTAMATVDVIRRAAADGLNLVITCEPTFFSRTDDASPSNRGADPIFAGKRSLIAERQVVVWRLRDTWRARTPDPMVDGLASALGWTLDGVSGMAGRVQLPPTTLRSVVEHVRTTLGAGALRVVGAPDLPVRRVLLSPGPSAPAVTFANLADTDVIVAGEPREWEGVEYVQDAIAAGMPKAMVIVGRVLTEDPGMRLMAGWLKGVVPGVRSAWLPVGDPYWRP
jgi:putative NIF3 family GTP cyclohydrolase 1 type 2